MSEYNFDYFSHPDVDFHIGKYLIAHNANYHGINYFTYYEDKLEDVQKDIDELKEELSQWNQMSEEDQYQYLKKANKETITILQSMVQDHKKYIKGLSQIITTLNTKDLDHPQHFDEKKTQTALLEVIQQRNNDIGELKEEIRKTQDQIVDDPDEKKKVMLLFEEETNEHIDKLKEKAKRLETQAAIMEERKKWVSQTFQIPMEEINNLIQTVSEDSTKNN